jgi:hypothetical protein
MAKRTKAKQIKLYCVAVREPGGESNAPWRLLGGKDVPCPAHLTADHALAQDLVARLGERSAASNLSADFKVVTLTGSL